MLLAGCELPGSNTGPTPYPSGYLPTVIYLTAESINATAAASVTPTLTPTITPTLIPPTLAPTNTPTPLPGVPLAAIQIYEPGPASKIISPLQVQMLAIADRSKKVEVDLYGEDGRLLGRSVRSVPGSGRGDQVTIKIPFEIRAAAEKGQVQVSTKDEYGRLQSLNSVDVLLLSSGASQINPAGNSIYERLTLYKLPPQASFSGGVLTVQGRYLPFNNQPAFLELVSDDKDGKSLGLRVLTFTSLDTQNISTTIPYKVSGPTPARLLLRQADDITNGPQYIYIFSQEITLNP